MRILVSNDDGVYAPGLAALVEAMKEIATVDVVAPDRNCSGVSNSLTLTNPLRAKTIENGYISVEGTPTDCVHLALTGLLERTPDLVVSGINSGANLGDDVLYSGTVAAATEGRFLGLPAIAISLVGSNFNYFKTAGKVAQHLVKHIHLASLPSQTILNVNVPDIPYEDIQGYEVTRLGTRHSAEPTVRQIDPRGQEIFWVGPPGAEEDAGPGSDFYAINQNKVSISPLKVDLTNYDALQNVSGWISGIDANT